jgi:hypothetical protein
VYRGSENSEVAPKNVEINNRIALYVVYEYAGVINEEFGYWNISLLLLLLLLY